MGKLDGRRALVTGASRGIGRGIALAFAEAGADVAIGYRREVAAAESTVKAIEAKGRRAFAFPADVRNADAVAAMVHGGQEFVWGEPVVAGDEITTTCTVKDVSERNGMGFYVFQTESVNQKGEKVCTATWTNIGRGV